MNYFKKASFSLPLLLAIILFASLNGASLYAQETMTGDDELFYEVLESVRKKEELEIVESVLKRIIAKQSKTDMAPRFSEESKVKNVKRIRIEKLIEEDLSKDIIIPLMECWDSEFQVKFFCNPEWGLREEEDALFFMIDTNPAVTMTITRIQSEFRFLYQMNKEDLTTIGIYADGFATEELQLSDQPAIKVKAYSKQFPEMRMSDYYFVNDGTLYGLLFSVDPKESWKNYKFIIEKIANNVEFKNNSESAISNDKQN